MQCKADKKLKSSKSEWWKKSSYDEDEELESCHCGKINATQELTFDIHHIIRHGFYPSSSSILIFFNDAASQTNEKRKKRLRRRNDFEIEDNCMHNFLHLMPIGTPHCPTTKEYARNKHVHENKNAGLYNTNLYSNCIGNA